VQSQVDALAARLAADTALGEYKQKACGKYNPRRFLAQAKSIIFAKGTAGQADAQATELPTSTGLTRQAEPEIR